MDYSVKSGAPERQRTDCAVVGVYARRSLSDAAKALDSAGDGLISRVVASGDLKSGLGQTCMILDTDGLACKRILLVSLGKRSEFDLARQHKALDAATRAVVTSGSKDAVMHIAVTKDAERIYRSARAMVEVAEVVGYRYTATRSERSSKPPVLRKVALAVSGRADASVARRGIEHGEGVAAGVALARSLGDLPGNVCTPSYLAKTARDLAKGDGRLRTKILEEADMKRLGMGALLSVSKGSRQPAKLIIMEYRNGKRGARPHVLVGKGLTFDAGGISIKPSPAMDEMKYDMCGGAGVFGTMRALKDLDLPINVIGIVPSSENLPDGAANKPGDVVKSMAGRTIEILNTDAEGRLILCDALTYAQRYKPESLIDIATLTGACVIALGHHATGVFSKREKLSKELIDAGVRSGDRGWPMPIWDEYQDQIKSPFADIANVGGRDAGAITAACFLSRFTDDQNWAHLDIAGTAWRSGGPKGATGRPVPMLVEYLLGKV